MAQMPESQDEIAPAAQTSSAVPLECDVLRRQILRFGGVGVVGFAINASLVEVLVHATGPIWAQVMAFPVAASATWWLNRRYTFGASRRKPHHEWLRYVFANSVGWVVNNGVFIAVIYTLPMAYTHPSIAVAIGSIAGMTFNFIASKKIVFNVDGNSGK